MGASSRQTDVIRRLHKAMNDHDIDAFLECFHEDYESVRPIRPSRNFRGRAQVEKNWSTIFKNIPDYRAELIRMVEDGDVVWAEWHWGGTQPDGQRMNMRGVVLFGIQEERISWGRLYIEVAEERDEDIDDWVQQTTEGRRKS